MADPLSTGLKRWGTIGAQLRQAGIHDSQWQAFAKADLRNIASGKQGLTNQEIVDAITTSVRNQPTVNPDAHKSHGPLDLIGNFASDVGQAAFDFVPGVVKLATQLSPVSFHEGLGNPLQEPELAHDLREVVAHDPATLHKYGLDDPSLNILEYISRAPVGNLIPGLHTAANLTSDKGREEILEHPGFTALDVLPIAAGAGRLATAGVEAAEGGAAEALQQGRVARGIGRGAYDIAQKATERLPGPTAPTRAELQLHLERTGLSTYARDNILKPLASIRNATDREFSQFMSQDWMQRFVKITDDQRSRITNAMTRGEWAGLSPEETAMARAGIATNAMVTEAAVREGNVIRIPPIPGAPDTRPQLYAKESAVGKAFRAKKDLERRSSTARIDLMDAMEAHSRVIQSGNETAITRSQRKLVRAEAKASDLESRHRSAIAKFDKAYRTHAPAAYHPALRDLLRKESVAKYESLAADNQFSSAQISHDVQTILDTPYAKDIQNLIGKKEFNALRRDIEKTWADPAMWQRAGITSPPEFVHNTLTADNEFIRPRVGIHQTRTKSSLAKTLNLAESGMDVVVGVEKNMADYLTHLGNKEVFDNHIAPILQSTDDLMRDTYLPMARRVNAGVRVPGYRTRAVHGDSVSAIATRLLHEDFTDYSKAEHGFGDFVSGTGEGLVLPKGVAKSLNSLRRKEAGDLPLIGRASPLTRLWKFSVLSTPRHMAHIALGGMTMGLTYEPGFVLQLNNAARLMRAVHRGEAEFLPEIMGQHINDLDSTHILQYASGKSIGRILSTLGKPIDLMNRAEEMVTTMYKIAATLSGEKRGLAHAEALELANKVFVDVNSMSAIEQTWIRSVFPFYGFSRHLVRYMANLAVDHPVRLSVLSNLANIQRLSQTHTLPGSFQNVFFLGDTDQHGNITGIDFRSINPFRSTYNMMTLAGVLSSFNPAIQTLLQTAGVNTLSATPELYPQLHVDPQTGQLVATHSAGNILSNAFTSYVPELRAAESIFAQSDQMKYLAKNDPEALHRLTFSALGIPFEMSQFNLSKVAQTLELKRYKQAQKDVSDALSKNDFSTLSSYNQVPAPRWLARMIGSSYISPAQLQRAWALLLSRSGGVDPRALMKGSR